MEKFFEVVAPLAKLGGASRNALSDCLKAFNFRKGHILVRQDTVCSHLYFIERGLTRTFYYVDGKDVTDWISPENTFAVSILSFLTRKPDRRIIELLEDSELWALSYEDLQRLCAAHHEIETFGRRLAESGVVQIQERFDASHFSSAADRYQMLVDKNPDYLNRIPLGILASFIGITQETLSRVRKHNAEKKR